MSRKLRDPYFIKAKNVGYLARSAFKLLEIQSKYKVIRPEANVIDLGCSPGAWLQVASELTKGLIVGIDIKGCELPPRCQTKQISLHQQDVFQLDLKTLPVKVFDTVLSDMCQPTTGVTFLNAARSYKLGSAAADLALGTSGKGMTGLEPCLHQGGNLVIKQLEGQEFNDLCDRLRPAFDRIHFFRPNATRRESTEVYIVCLRRR